MPDTPAATPAAADAPSGLSTALALLADGVPLSLLLDLAAPVPSHELYRREAADVSWLRTA